MRLAGKLIPDESGCTENRGIPFGETGGKQLYFVPEDVQHELLHVAMRWLENQIPRIRKSPKKHDRFGICMRDRVG